LSRTKHIWEKILWGKCETNLVEKSFTKVEFSRFSYLWFVKIVLFKNIVKSRQNTTITVNGGQYPTTINSLAYYKYSFTIRVMEFKVGGEVHE
jgi:hypothetical protein